MAEVPVEVTLRAAFEPFVQAVRQVADGLAVLFPGPFLPGVQALAEASDRISGGRRGERPCGVGTHDELVGRCSECQAQR